MALLEAIRAFVSLDGSGFEAGAKRIESMGAKLGSGLSRHLGGVMVRLIGIAAIEEGIRRTVVWADKMESLAKRAGVGVEPFQQMAFAAEQANASVEEMVGFMERLNLARAKALGGGKEGKQAAESFAAFGISMDQLKTARSEDLMKQIAGVIKTGDIQKFTEPLRDIGGKGAGALVEAFKDGLADKMAEAPVVPAETIHALAEVNDKFEQLGWVLRSDLAPALAWGVERLYDFRDALKIIGAALGATVGTVNVRKAWDEREQGTRRTIVGALFNTDKFSIKNSGLMGFIHGISEQLDQARFGEGFKKAMDNVVDEIAKERAERMKPIALPIPPGEFKSTHTADEKAAKLPSGGDKISIDRLAKMGGFVGGGEAVLIDVGRQQLAALKRIEANTKAKPGTNSESESLIY